VDFASQHGLDPAARWIGLLPGSRPREIALNLPGMVGAAALLSQENEYEWVLPLAPTLIPGHIAEITRQLRELGALVRQEGLRHEAGVSHAPRITLVRDARATLHHAHASIVASGTATVEAALLGNPFLVVYRVSPLTYAIARRVVTVPHVAMVNLVAGRRAVPELIQHDFTPAKVASALRPLLNDEAVRQILQAELRRVRGLLASGGPEAIESVALATLAAASTSTARSAEPRQPVHS
jgi:lipid-A-disaccharide synthase